MEREKPLFVGRYTDKYDFRDQRWHIFKDLDSGRECRSLCGETVSANNLAKMAAFKHKEFGAVIKKKVHWFKQLCPECREKLKEDEKYHEIEKPKLIEAYVHES